MSGDRGQRHPRAEGRVGLSLDPVSRTVLTRFGFSVVLVIGWYLIWRDQAQLRLTMMAMLVCGCTTAVAAARRERPRAPVLNRWDEAAAWLLMAAATAAFGL